MRKITLVTRTGCHLCEAAANTLADLDVDLLIVDIDEVAGLERFSHEVPVVLDGHWTAEEPEAGRVLTRLVAAPAALKKALRPTLWRRITGKRPKGLG
ncbi:MAG: glutaredoxin family protein [Flaviflexus sp.]|nr:glutaredoxin family protein [Flaviflexus sp.]